MKSILLKLWLRIISRLPLRNIILFESIPSYSDNTWAVFKECVKRGMNKKYKLVWVTNDDAAPPEDIAVNNVISVKRNEIKLKYYYLYLAKLIVCCNDLLPKPGNSHQYYCDLAHGCAFKNCSGKYGLPNSCKDADVITISEFMAPYDAHNLSCSPDCMRNLGYPRNDDLFKHNFDFNICFGAEFEKVICWMPTYRQHKTVSLVHSNISIPIIHNENIALEINEFAKRNNILIIVKIHNSQDISKINEYDFSNLKFIDNDFLKDNGVLNYELLGSCDALLSDYSSVYYDFLLVDKPIGLCWEDFDEYNKREGFTIDPEFIMAGGEKIYTVDDLCAFIARIANNEDLLKDKRNEIKNLVHDHMDNQSTKRVVDYLETKIL